MKKHKIFFFLGLLILVLTASTQLYSQTKAKVENVDFFPDGNTVIITYDIAKYKAGETFKVWVNVYSESGQKIIPNALSGEVGSQIPGGPYKRIVWDMAADQTFLDEEIAVVVLAESEGIFGKKQKSAASPSGNENKPGISVGGAMGLSLLLPGLGRRVATGEGAAYLWGVAGYGCLGGAYFLNNKAYQNYEDYKTATTPESRDDYYKKAKNNDLYSKILVGAAATIWVVDLIVTGVKTSKIRKSSYHSQRLSFTANYDPVIQRPTFGVQVRF